MRFTRLNSGLTFLLFFWISCSVDTKTPEINNAIKPQEITFSGFVVIDIDKCNSCFVENGGKIQALVKDTENLVVILSNSRKKANFFGTEYRVKFVWDSTRYFEKYLPENGGIYFSEGGK